MMQPTDRGGQTGGWLHLPLVIFMSVVRILFATYL